MTAHAEDLRHLPFPARPEASKARAAAERLPPLREELNLLPGAALADGQPSWSLHDPARNLYFQIDWPSFEMLARWHLGDAQAVADATNADTTLHVHADDVQALARFLAENELLPAAPGLAARWSAQHHARRGSFGQWLLHNYLFLRIPLVRPDAWLTRWHPVADVFYRPAFRRLTLLVAVLGLIGVLRDWAHFAGSFVDLLSWQGLAAYGITLAGVHVLHELGHAFTAKRFGCRVPSMGVALLVLWPVAYTDTNDAWRLTRRRERLMVDGAGILTELTLAAWATLAWVLLPEGALKTGAFLLASTTWISTLVVNASPFMRFDGYFLLADALQMPNLHGRAFALARWHLRERLFALGEPPPEHFAPGMQRGLVAFAWGTWLYRLVLFIGIAVLVYHFAFKLLGIVLFVVEIAWFIAVPVLAELRVWWSLRARVRQSGRARVSALLLLALATVLLLPWPVRVAVSGVTLAAGEQQLYAPPQAQVRALQVREGQAVLAGAPLLELDSPALAARSARNRAQGAQLGWNAATAGLDAEQRKSWQVLGSQFAGSQAERQEIAAEAQRYAQRATLAGTVRDLDPDLRPGDWLAAREPLGRVVPDAPGQVVVYVRDEDVARLALGQRGLFLARGGAGPNLALQVTDIARDASHLLEEPELAALYGGDVQVREKNGVLFAEQAVYRVLLRIDTPDAATVDALRQHRWLGLVAIHGEWEAPGLRYLRHLAATLRREAGF